MKNLLVCLPIVFLSLTFTPGLAQDTIPKLTKVEKRKWKKIANFYKKNPQQLKALREKQKLYKIQLAEKDHKIGMSEIQINDLSRQLAMARTTIWELAEQMEIDTLLPNNVGVVYKLQIGAFAETKLPPDLEEAKQIDVEDVGDLQKILIGSFRDYEKAKRLGAYLKAMGIEDAWIVGYLDGKRVPVEATRKKVIKP